MTKFFFYTVYIFKRYIYNGIINVDNLDANEILELLEACDELCFNELIDDLQNYLIKERKKEWIQQNINYFYINILSKSQSFDLLQIYFDKEICRHKDYMQSMYLLVRQ